MSAAARCVAVNSVKHNLSCTENTGSDVMDMDVLDAHLDSVSRSEACDVNHFDSAFTNAFLKTDEEFGKVRFSLSCSCFD